MPIQPVAPAFWPARDATLPKRGDRVCTGGGSAHSHPPLRPCGPPPPRGGRVRPGDGGRGQRNRAADEVSAARVTAGSGWVEAPLLGQGPPLPVGAVAGPDLQLGAVG